jgi:L-iditol 2-dehydrogenase
MRAAILKEPGCIEICRTARPVPAAGEVLVKVKSALTCGTDLKAFLRGHALIPMPGPFGHEYSGVVAGKGKGVKRFRIGSPVMGVHSAPCLKCAYCRRRHYNLCEDIMSTKVLGSYAEYLLIPRRIVEQNLFKKPENLSFDEAAFLEPLACVVHGMEPLNITGKDTVLVMGAGPIGLLHLLRALSLGAKVLVTGLEEERLKTAKMLGATAVFHPSLAGEAVSSITDGLGVDYVFECTGQPQVWENSVDYVRRGGTVVLFGGCKKGAAVTYDAARLHYDEITLKGAFHFTPLDVRKAYVLLKRGTIVVKRLISGACSLNRIQDAFTRLSRGEGMKYVVRP